MWQVNFRDARFRFLRPTWFARAEPERQALWQRVRKLHEAKQEALRLERRAPRCRDVVTLVDQAETTKSADIDILLHDAW